MKKKTFVSDENVIRSGTTPFVVKSSSKRGGKIVAAFPIKAGHTWSCWVTVLNGSVYGIGN